VPELHALMELTQSVARRAGRRLLETVSEVEKSYVHSREFPREIKSTADKVLEDDILRALRPTGLAILSEEAGYIPAREKCKYWFIVDPLDGTYNFVKGLGPSAVSIAIWDDQTPIFGALYCLAESRLAWGGAGLGAYIDGRPISVSDTATRAQASICTGFPVRFDFGSEHARQQFWDRVRPYAKVRMLGSAAVSLLHVAKGSADLYSEQNIMLWDIAAGLAIVEGAGGGSVLKRADAAWSYDVSAANPRLLSQFTELAGC
jgi:myo-inositol-1(or 4)-monophosphatase